MMWIWLSTALAAPPVVLGSGAQPIVPPSPPVIESPIEDDLSTQIIGGKREVAYGSAVALVLFDQAVCTASMITPTVALTAGHCVAEGGLSPDLIELGGSIAWGLHATEPIQVAKVTKVHLHPGYTLEGQLPDNDLALLEIERPEFTETVWINEDPIQAGKELVSVGYGITQYGNNQSSGNKRSATLTIDEIQDPFLVSNSDTNPNRANVCSGDSGGPMYGYDSNGRLRQYAVHSWSEMPGCQGISGSTSTALRLDFIINTLEEIAGSSDLCELREVNEDAFCDPECPNDIICAINEQAAAGGCGCSSHRSPLQLTWFIGLALLGLRRRSL